MSTAQQPSTDLLHIITHEAECLTFYGILAGAISLPSLEDCLEQAIEASGIHLGMKEGLNSMGTGAFPPVRCVLYRPEGPLGIAWAPDENWREVTCPPPARLDFVFADTFGGRALHLWAEGQLAACRAPGGEKGAESHDGSCH